MSRIFGMIQVLNDIQSMGRPLKKVTTKKPMQLIYRENVGSDVPLWHEPVVAIRVLRI
jgi:hypothetical protein